MALNSVKTPEEIVDPNSITPDLEGVSDNEQRPRILMQESFQLTSEKFAFDQSVTFESQKINPIHTSGKQFSEGENKMFWDNAAIDLNNQIIKMSDTDKLKVEDMQLRMH